MTMEILDRRIQRTQRALAEALIALTLEHGYEAVTIRDITERAHIGYATFFRHYPDKDALLEAVGDVVLDELLNLLQAAMPGGDPAGEGTLIFQYVAEHSAVCRALLSSRGSAAVVQRMIALGAATALHQNTPLAHSSIPPEVAAHHLVAATVALIRWWLDYDTPYPPERMGAIYHELIIHPTRAVAFQV